MEVVAEKILRGTNKKQSHTGKDRLSMVLCQLENGPIYNLCHNGYVYSIHEDIESYTVPTRTEITDESEFDEMDESFKSFFGFNFGDVLPDSFLKHYEEEHGWTEDQVVPIFLGKCVADINELTNNACEEHVHIVFVKKDGNTDRNYMPYNNITTDEFVETITSGGEEQKKMVVHYINNEGVKTKADVNAVSEIKDLKEFLYKFDN